MSFLVRRELFDRCAKHLIGINVNKFSLNHVYEYVHSMSSRVVFNGTDIISPQGKYSFAVYMINFAVLYTCTYIRGDMILRSLLI